MLVEITGANEMYTTKRFKCAHSVLYSKVLRTYLPRGDIFENVGFFLKKRDKPSRFFKKYAKTSNFSYIQIVLKSSMLDVV